MKLFMVHVGFYDDEVGEGIYESHINIFVAAGNPKSAKKKITWCSMSNLLISA